MPANPLQLTRGCLAAGLILLSVACASERSSAPLRAAANPSLDAGSTYGDVRVCKDGPTGTYSFTASATSGAVTSPISLYVEQPITGQLPCTLVLQQNGAPSVLTVTEVTALDGYVPTWQVYDDFCATFAGCPDFTPARNSLVSPTGELYFTYSFAATDQKIIVVRNVPGCTDRTAMNYGQPGACEYPPACPPSTISSNFNGTAVDAGDYIWFNAVFKPTGVTSAGGKVDFTGGVVTFTSNGTNYAVPVPPSTVNFSPTATTASTSFDGTRWTTTVPWNYTANIFLGGAAFQVPAGGLPGGTNPVAWSESMTTNISGLTLNWKWAAAAYTSFASDLASLGVKPVDSNSLSIYLNSDHAGTPESFKAFVTGGARGGGGSNFTGSYSGTKSNTPCPAP